MYPGGRRLRRLDYITGLLGAVILIVFWLVVATFPSFFFFNPLGHENQLRRFELLVSTIGWILISTGSPLILFLFASGRHQVRKYLPFTALLYPASLVISQATTYVQTGAPYLNYLINFPIFIFTDIVLPILILFVWHDLKYRANDGV